MKYDRTLNEDEQYIESETEQKVSMIIFSMLLLPLVYFFLCCWHHDSNTNINNRSSYEYVLLPLI